MTERFAGVLIAAYAAMLCAVGAAGIVTARWELAHIFHLSVDRWTPDVQATFLNQYRFLKALEFAAGVACLLSRPAILAGGRAAGLFVLLVAGGVAARSLAWIVDGRPATAFLIFLGLELLVLIVTLAHLRKARHP